MTEQPDTHRTYVTQVDAPTYFPPSMYEPYWREVARQIIFLLGEDESERFMAWTRQSYRHMLTYAHSEQSRVNLIMEFQRESH